MPALLLRLAFCVLAFQFIAFPECDLFAEQKTPPIKKTSLDLPAQADLYAFIKILILSGADEIQIATRGPYRVLDQAGNTVYQGNPLPSTSVKVYQNSIQLGIQPIGSNPVTIESEGGEIQVKGGWYRHALEIWREENGKLTVINDIPIEDYLKGVLPSEVNPKWPMESLKAQAVASRTYALFKMLENQNRRHHLSKDVLSQVYGGKNLEHSLTTQAVELTQGQILTYNGKIFPAYFHSTCGGHTTHAEYIWPVEPHPSLRGVECNFCWQSKHSRWTAEISGAEIAKKLNRHGFKISGMDGITLGEKDETGRAKFFLLQTAGGSQKIHSNDFRLWVDPMKLKSTWIQMIEKRNGKFYFKGRGWGHGVGICQYGIKQLGEMGYAADRILYYYYPGSQLSQYWTNQPLSVRTSIKSWITKIKEQLDLA